MPKNKSKEGKPPKTPLIHVRCSEELLRKIKLIGFHQGGSQQKNIHNWLVQIVEKEFHKLPNNLKKSL